MTKTIGQALDGKGAQTDRADYNLEASTMALYVSVVLLATLAAIHNTTNPHAVNLLEIIWATTVGLALAHFFAFRVASRLVRGTAFHRHDLHVAFAQLGGALAVAVVSSIPVVLLPPSSENDVVRLLLGLLMGIAGYASGRTGAASRPRSLALGALTLVLGVTVALIKNSLGGH